MTTDIDLVRAFRGLRVLCIGDAMLDSYLEGSATRLCTEGPVPVVRKTTEEHSPGGAANTATNLRSLGAEVFFLGLVGPDGPGALLRSALRDTGVEDAWLVEDSEVSTLHKQRILSDDQYVVRFDSGDTRSLSSSARKLLLEGLEQGLRIADLVVVSDYRYGVLFDELISRITEKRTERAVPLVVDSKDLHRFSGVHATVITPNALEARLAVEPMSRGDGPIDLDEMSRIGNGLLAEIDAEWAAITMAGDGVLLVGRGNATHFPAHPVPHANDVGAGDSFAAALSLALAAGGSIEQAVSIGIESGSIAVTRSRTAVVSQQQLLQRVSRASRRDASSPWDVTLTLDEARSEGKRIVFTNGVFDILHAGHIHFLREARSLGDILVVGINSDRSARHLKGKDRPISSERDRLELVAALDPVDHVVLFNEDTPAELIRQLRPDVHVKGGDYEGEDLPEAEVVREVGGRVVILPLVGDLSTSRVIERILSLSSAMAADGLR